MNFSSSQKTLLIVLAVMWLLYFFNQPNFPIQNDGSLNEAMSADTEASVTPVSVHAEVNETAPEQNADAQALDEAVRAAQASLDEADTISTINSASNGYANSSYSGAQRGNTGGDWAAAFEHGNSVIASGLEASSGDFSPMDETAGSLATFTSTRKEKCGTNGDCPTEDLFDNSNYLPQEVNNDWFDVQPEPISVKNRHLVNVTRPYGVSTVSSSLKNPTLDIRGTPACPKFVVSPWHQSSIEPDHNLKPLMG